MHIAGGKLSYKGECKAYIERKYIEQGKLQTSEHVIECLMNFELEESLKKR